MRKVMDATGNDQATDRVRRRSADDYNTGSYLFDELWHDLCGVGEGPELRPAVPVSFGTDRPWHVRW